VLKGKVDCAESLATSHVIQIMEIFLYKRLNERNTTPQRQSPSFSGFNKKMLWPLTQNPFYTPFCQYLRKNEFKILAFFEEDKMACRKKAFNTLLDEM